MSVAKVIELSGRSTQSFEQAIKEAIDKAGETVENIEGAWVSEQQVVVENGEISSYDVNLRITFRVD